MRIVLAILAGFVTTFVLATGTDVLSHVIAPGFSHTHPMRLEAVSLVYTLIYAIAGGYVTARIENARPMAAALILAGIALAISAAVLLPAPRIPLWYKAGTLVLLLPLTVFGGYIASRNKTAPRTMAAAH